MAGKIVLTAARTPEAECVLELADLADRASAAKRELRRRVAWALGLTLIAPVNFLAQALILWADGWSTTGPAALAASVAFAVSVSATVVAWKWCRRAWLSADRHRAELRRRGAALSDALKPRIETGVLWGRMAR